jgi:PAS domain S-box-containing protein
LNQAVRGFGLPARRVACSVGHLPLGLAPLPTPELKSLIAAKVAALRTEAGLATILDGIGEGFYALDRDYRIILFNSEAEKHFRRPAREMIGHILWELFPAARETELGQQYFRVMASRETIRSEAESVIFGVRWLAYRLFPLGDGIGVVFRDITDRKRAEEQRDLLVKELEHRVKNTLATVQSIASQSFRTAADPNALRAFEARLIALGNVHGLLTRQSWDSAELQEIVWLALRPHSAPDSNRFTVEGPSLRLGPKSAVAFSMAMHELATNAVKYGALSAPSGHVEVRWNTEDERFSLLWRESGGPAISSPGQTGFGTRMIERALAMQLSGQVTIDYQPSGVVCTIDAPLAAMRDNEAD